MREVMAVWNCAKGILVHKYVALLFRLYIGGVFVFAGMYKMAYPGEFAEVIAGYQLVPYWAVNLFAAILPWMEMICGILLLVGLRSKSAAAAIGGMLVMFIAAILISLLRGIPIGCGCFSSTGETMDWVTLTRDVVWFVMTLHVYFFDSALQLEKWFIAAVTVDV